MTSNTDHAYNQGVEKQPNNLTIYLGGKAEAERRLRSLDGLASRLGVSRSKMIQMLADGKLMLVVAPDTEPLAQAG